MLTDYLNFSSMTVGSYLDPFRLTWKVVAAISSSDLLPCFLAYSNSIFASRSSRSWGKKAINSGGTGLISNAMHNSRTERGLSSVHQIRFRGLGSAEISFLLGLASFGIRLYLPVSPR